MTEFETLLYEETDGVAWVTLNRPEVLNAFDSTMQRELRELWRSLRLQKSVRCVVLTGAGNKAFCAGIDRGEISQTDDQGDRASGYGSTRFHFDDPGSNVGPKANDLWVPVISAVNGLACGGAFYLLGESEFIIAAEHATFFDPHVTFGLTAAFESVNMLQKMPFGEIMRVALLGSNERLSVQRAHEIGLVTEVVAAEDLAARARWAAECIASAPPLAVQGTVRSLWAARDLPRTQALTAASAYVAIGNQRDTMTEGQQVFAAGQRVDWQLR